MNSGLRNYLILWLVFVGVMLLKIYMPVIQDFGLITAVTVFFSLLLALLLLPVLIELSARNQEEVVEVNEDLVLEA